MQFLIDTIAQVQWQQVVMWIIGGILIFLAIKKGMEPALLLPMGFGAILVNIPNSAVIGEGGIIQSLFEVGIEAFPMSARVIEKMGIQEDPSNHLLMHAVGANVSGQIASATIGGLIIGLVQALI